ncbi:peptidase inhibitor family I36 protein [Saccharothrix algeriensis]|uniref:Uncharacterized protein n=2 Tax=Saccharothrix algeriensis TaxID=173560 RepID=A0ABS2SG69_9PSEU|nr:peptidase inhibitor family I36 protein [Saccharothrix algeriensis]MBM7815256.1 hypothetical protein [Saccharothrix algeriensis]
MRAIRTALVALFIVAASMCSATAANAREGDYCSPDQARICTWTDVNYQGSQWDHDYAMPSGECIGLVVGVLSVKNRVYIAQRFWENLNCTGRNVLVFHNQDVPAFEFVVHGWGGI